MHEVLAGLVAALPLSLLGLVYIVAWGSEAVTTLMVSDLQPADMAKWPMFTLLLSAFALAPLVFGVIAGLVYAEVQSFGWFLALAMAMAALFSLAALLSRTPMKMEKVVMNFMMALVLGTLIPLLTTV